MARTGGLLGARLRRTSITLLDAIQFFFLLGLSILQIGLWNRVPQSRVLLLLYIGCFILLAVTALTARSSSRPAARLLDDLIVPIIILLVVFETLGYSIPAVNTAWLEPALVRMDGWFFGMTGSEFLERYYSRPLLDLMHLFYVSFYFVPVSLLIIMYRRGNRAEFQHTVAAIGLTFYTDFLLYFVFPVLGPYRNPDVHFTREIMASGGMLTRVLRGFLDHAEITAYDSFPSGHVAATLISILLAYRYRLAIRGFYVFLGVMIVISTVYLRYHYVADLPAGALVAVAIYRISPHVGRVVIFCSQTQRWLRYQRKT
jgi:membrane-associated phospholipid phosphatase